MGAAKNFKQTLDDNIDHFVEAVLTLRRNGNISDSVVRSLSDLLKVAQSRTVDDFLGLGYDSPEQRPPKLERYQHGACISDGTAIPRTDVGG